MRVKTPCVGLCTATSLGDKVCKGCKRTFEEVRDWNTYSEKQKEKIIKNIANRYLQIK